MRCRSGSGTPGPRSSMTIETCGPARSALTFTADEGLVKRTALRSTFSIALDDHRLLGRGPIDGLLGRARFQARVLDDLVHQEREIQRLARQRGHSSQMRKLQNLPDHDVEPLRLQLDAIELP